MIFSHLDKTMGRMTNFQGTLERMGEPSGQKARSLASDLPIVPEAPSPAATEDPPLANSLVARLCSISLAVFKTIINLFKAQKDLTSAEKKALISCRRSLDRLQLWSDDYGICFERQDVNFAKSPNLRRATLKILTSIGRILLERLAALSCLQQTPSSAHKEGFQWLKELVDAAHSDCINSDSSSDSGTDYGSDSILEISEDLKTDTLCLMELDPMFESPVLDSNIEHSIAELWPSNWASRDVYKDKIRSLYPKAHDSLVLRLSKAARGRYLRCQQIRERKTSGGRGISSTESLLQAEKRKRCDALSDSGGDIPPLPERAKRGESFTCFACGRVVSLTTELAWRKHLHQDLLPWQCLDGECPCTNVFQVREDWIRHLSQEHMFAPSWVAIECPLCLNTTGAGKASITQHLGNHLETISTYSLPFDKTFVFQSSNKQAPGEGASSLEPLSAPKEEFSFGPYPKEFEEKSDLIQHAQSHISTSVDEDAYLEANASARNLSKEETHPSPVGSGEAGAAKSFPDEDEGIGSDGE